MEAVGGTAVGCLVPSRLISFKLRGAHLASPQLTAQLFLCTSQPATPQSNGRRICASLSACVMAHCLDRFYTILQAGATPLELPYLSLSFVKTETI